MNVPIASTLAAGPTERPGTSVWIDPPLVFVAIAAALCTMPSRLLSDPDSHWHVAIGRLIWARAAVPWVDEHSHTFAGAPWIAKEWLSQLLLSGAYAIGGWMAVALVAALTVALTFTLLFAWLAGRVRVEAAIGLTLAATVLCVPHFLARPHVFAFLTLFLWTRGLVDAVEERRAPSLPLVALMALWANLHGSFTVGYGVAGLLAAEAVLAAAREDRLGTALRWGGFLLLALLAGCATPYGLRSFGVTATLFGSGESLPFIHEWQPLGWGPLGLAALASAAAQIVALARGGWPNALRIAIVGALAAMTIRHARFLDVFAIVAPAVAAGPLARRFARLRASPGDAAPAERRWPALLPVLAIAVGAALIDPPRPAADTTPRAALAAARRLPVSGPVYNDYDFGGFLLAEGVPTFIDGRTDQLFLGGFISGLYRAVYAPTGEAFEALLDRHGVTWALLKTRSPERVHLDGSARWRVIHLDEHARVYVRV